MDGFVNGVQGAVAGGTVQVAPAAGAALAGSAQYTAVDAKMFTQDQVNSIVQDRVNKKNLEIQALQQQIAASQQQATLIQQQYQTVFNELNGYRQRDAAIKAGVPERFVDFAVFEASKLAVNGKTFEVAIKEYAAANAQLFGVSPTSAQGGQAGSPTAMPPAQANAGQAQAAGGQGAVNTTQQGGLPQVNPVAQAMGYNGQVNNPAGGQVQNPAGDQVIGGFNQVLNGMGQPTVGGTMPQQGVAPTVSGDESAVVQSLLKSRGLIR